MPKLNRKPDPERAGKSLAQSVLLPKDWTRAKVVKWLEEHDFISSGIDEPGESGEFWRARQYDPEHFTRFAIQPLPSGSGVRIVLGVVKGQRKDGRLGTARVEYGMVIDASESAEAPWVQRMADGSLLLNRVPIMRESVNRYGDRLEFKDWDDVKDAAQSFEDAAITFLHPPDRMVDAESFREVGRGHIKGPFVFDEQNRIIWGKAHIADGELAEKVLSGDALGVSPGFFCETLDSPGRAPDGTAYDGRQVFMTGNHMAFGPTNDWARADLKIALDGKGDVILGAELASDQNNQEEAQLPEKIIVVDGKPFKINELDDGFEDAIRAREASIIKAVTDAKAETQDALGKLAAEQQAHTETKARLDAATSPAEIAKAAQARADLITRARLVSGKDDFTCDGDDFAVKSAALIDGGCNLDGIKDKPDGYQKTYIDAMFDFRFNTASSEQKAITDAWSPNTSKLPVIDHSSRMTVSDGSPDFESQVVRSLIGQAGGVA
jgi:hypothetical protein